MNTADRLRRLMDALGMNSTQMAEVFGVGVSTFSTWYRGEKEMRPEFRATLLRLEGDNLPALSPKLRPETIEAFYAGRRRAQQEVRS
jgi:transcriptional regulator with XRE-family HTH domain